MTNPITRQLIETIQGLINAGYLVYCTRHDINIQKEQTKYSLALPNLTVDFTANPFDECLSHMKICIGGDEVDVGFNNSETIAKFLLSEYDKQQELLESVEGLKDIFNSK